MSTPIALQLWSIKDETEKDFVGALEAVANMGYDGVEFAGYGGLSAEVMKGHLDRLGLKAAGSHVNLGPLREDLEGQIAYNRAIGNKYIICPYGNYETKEEWIEMAKELAGYNQKIREAGLVLGYHNHGREFVEYDGKFVLDLILEQCPKLIAELDTYWSEFADVNTVDYLAKLGNRCKLVHLKDMCIKEDGSKSSCTYGEGILDNKAIIAAALKNNPEWLIIEWEAFTGSCLEAVEKSVKNLRALLGA